MVRMYRGADPAPMDPRLLETLRQGHGVLTRWQALEHVPEGVLRGLVSSGELVAVRHGVLVDGDVHRSADPAGLAAISVRAEQAVRRRGEVTTG